MSSKEQKSETEQRGVQIAYLVDGGLGGGGVDLASLLEERRQRQVLHYAAGFGFPPMVVCVICKSETEFKEKNRTMEKYRERERKKGTFSLCCVVCGRVHE